MIYREYVQMMMMCCDTTATVEGVPPLSLSRSKGKALKDLQIFGNAKRTVTIDGTGYVIPEGFTLLDNSGSTATAYYCRRQSDSSTGTINLVTDVFTASSFTAGNELPAPEVPLGVAGVGDKTENLLTTNPTLKRATYDAATGTITSTGVDTIALRLRLYNGSASPNSLPQSLGAHTYTFTANGNYTEFRHNGSANNIGVEWDKLLTPGEEYTLYYNVVSDDTMTIGGFVVSNLMIVEGSTAPSSYVPYGYKVPVIIANNAQMTDATVHTVYLGSTLYKLNSYTDAIMGKLGKVVRNIGCKVFDGTESWAGYARISNCYYIGIADSKASQGANVLCTHYQGKTQGTNNGLYIGATNIGSVQCGAFYFTDTDYADVTAWKAYLAAQYAAGTPLTVWYVLIAESEESVTVPTIATAKGQNCIDVETTVKPSSMAVRYIK